MGRQAGRWWSASSLSLHRASLFPLPPPSRASAAERAFGGLSNCLPGSLPRPTAVTARFPPARRAVRRRARAGRGARSRRYGTRRDEPIRRFISGWRGRHFVRVDINRRWGPPPVQLLLRSSDCAAVVRRPCGSRLLHADCDWRGRRGPPPPEEAALAPESEALPRALASRRQFAGPRAASQP